MTVTSAKRLDAGYFIAPRCRNISTDRLADKKAKYGGFLRDSVMGQLGERSRAFRLREDMHFCGCARRIRSGFVVGLGILGTAITLLAMGRVVGLDATWRAVGVLPPPFFDMHVINDYAACALAGR
jgi:hypothetical protein